MWSRFLMLAVMLSASPIQADEVDRPGIGDWCYNPIRTPTIAEKTSFVDEVSLAAVETEVKWGVPSPIVAAMAIVESGFGTTRLALKSNNVMAFKWPGETIGRGLGRFVLWCQPLHDKGNVYPSFETRGQAIDFVAWRLKESPHYRAATEKFQLDLQNNIPRRTAAERWLTTIAPTYNWKPEEYISSVLGFAGDPLGNRTSTLWNLEP